MSEKGEACGAIRNLYCLLAPGHSGIHHYGGVPLPVFNFHKTGFVIRDGGQEYARNNWTRLIIVSYATEEPSTNDSQYEAHDLKTAMKCWEKEHGDPMKIQCVFNIEGIG